MQSGTVIQDPLKKNVAHHDDEALSQKKLFLKFINSATLPIIVNIKNRCIVTI